MGHFDAVLQGFHLDTPLLQQQNTEKPYGTKNNCVEFCTSQPDSSPQLTATRESLQQRPSTAKNKHSLKNRVLRSKAGYCECPLYSKPPEGWAKHLSHPSDSTPGHTSSLTPCKEHACLHLGNKQAREFVACSHFSCCTQLIQGPQTFLARISCLSSSQFLFIKKAKNPGQ